MESIGFGLKQLLALLVSATLITATVPPPSAAVIGTSPVQLSRQISTFAPSSASDEEVPAQSASRAIRLKPRARLKPNAANPGARRTDLPVPEIAPDNPEAADKGPANNLMANRQAAMKMATLESGGLVFVENKGQFDPRVKFRVSNGGKTLWLTQNGIVLDFVKTHALASDVELPGENRPSQRSAGNPKVQNPIGQIAGRDVIYENFVGANDNPVIETKRLEEGVRNYLLGDDPKKWQTDVRGFSEIVYHDLWKGVNLRLYGNGPNLEQEFIVAPGTDYGQVRIAYQGTEGLKVERGGSLLIKTSAGQIRETAPRIYQRIAGRETLVKGRFKLLSPTSYTFQIAKYDAQRPLTIDPTLLYSTYLGGSAGNYSSCGLYFCATFNNEVATGIAVDTAGNAYVTGYTASTDFPTTPGALKTTAVSGSYNSFVTKFNPAGSGLIYSTYLNGTAGNASSSAIAVDANGNAYVTGYTEASTGFPTTPNAYAPVCSSTDFFVTGLNPTGNGLVYSSCFNISGTANSGVPYGFYPRAIALDSSGRACVTGGVGGSTAGVNASIPTTANAYQPSNPGGRASAFVAVFDTTTSGTSSLMFSTYFVIPGPNDNFGILANGIALDSFGNIYITGSAGPYLPVTAGAFQPTLSGAGPCPSGLTTAVCPDAFVAKFNPSVSGTQSLIYSTYLGGPGGTTLGTVGNGIAVDSAGSAYVTGQTGSAMFPVTPGAFQTAAGLGGNVSGAFVSKLSPSGSSLIYSTYLAGNAFASFASGNGIAVDSLGNTYVAGTFRAQASSTFPVTPDAFQNSFTKLTGLNQQEAFLTKLNAAGSALIYSSYLGGEGDDVATGVAVDEAGDAYVTGHTGSGAFPVSPHAFQPAVNGTGDAFVTKFPLGSSQALSLLAITPAFGGNAGTASPQIFGTGFHAGATAQLNCSSAIAGTNLTVGPGARFLNATFTLTGVPPGPCDVVVTNPDGTLATLPQAFTIQQGGAPNVQVYLTGVEVRKVPPEVAIGPANALEVVTISNTGNVDSKGTLVSLPVDSPFNPSSANPNSLDDTSTLPATSEVQWLPAPAAGSSEVVIATTNSATASTSPLTVQVCSDSDIQAYAECVNNQVASRSAKICPLIASKVQLACTTAYTSCLLQSNPADCSKALSLCYLLVDQCGGKPLEESIKKQCSQNANCTLSTFPILMPSDPNDLVGPPGVGAQRWVGGTQALSYIVSFQNDPTASVPAQQVFVTEPLGASANLSTLALLSVIIPNGSGVVQVPISPTSFIPAAGVDEFATSVDLRPDQGLLVSIDAKLDPATQTLTWTFTSIDPLTGLPPLNPLVGFLPPGAGANVSFSVTPVRGLATGAQVAEQATIVFQGASPMSTQVWTNTIDNTAPVSHVTGLASAEPASGFAVSWSGTDVGAGIQDFTIYVSDNGGPFTAFQTNTTATSATFTGQVGHTYGFYSIARDLVGNVEAGKTTAEATTLVSTGTPPAITSVNSVTFTFGSPGSFTVAATGFPTPTLSATGVPSGVTFADNGNGTATLSETTAAAGTYLITISASNVVGSPATQSFTLTVNRANQTITFSGVPASASFGQGPFNLTASATSGLPVSLVATGNCSLSANSLSLIATGSCTVVATQPGNGNYNAAPSLSPSFAISQATTATTVTVSPGTVKYSDYTTLAASVSPASAGGQALTGSVQFFLNGNAVGSPVVINSSGGATLSQLQVNLSATNYPVKAVFSSTNQNFAGSTGTTTQNVTQENAFILYSGDTIAQVGTSLNLRATVWDSAATGYPGVNPESGPTATIGDITKIWIAFDIYPAGSCGSGTPSTLYAQAALTGTPGIGTATTTLSSSSEVSYCVVSRLVAGNTGGTNLFYAAPNAETAGLDFYVNSGQFATGGGWVNDPTGSHGNFGFNARYNSAGSPKGQMVYVFRSSYNGVLADFIIKSNALSALQFSGTTYPISSTLQGKVNVQINRASDGLSLFSAGNYTFSATVTDSGQNGATGKQFSLTVYDSNGVPYHQVAANTPLQGGNVVVHSQ